VKRNFNQPLLDLKGQPMAAGDTLKDAAINSLLGQLVGDERQSGTDKVKCFKLAQKIEAGDPVELTTEELATIKDRIGKGMFTLVVGRCFELLEQDYVEA